MGWFNGEHALTCLPCTKTLPQPEWSAPLHLPVIGPHLQLCPPSLPACNSYPPLCLRQPYPSWCSSCSSPSQTPLCFHCLFLTWNSLTCSLKHLFGACHTLPCGCNHFPCIYVYLLYWKLLEGRGHVLCFSVGWILKNHSINIFRLVVLNALGQFTPPYCAQTVFF